MSPVSLPLVGILLLLTSVHSLPLLNARYPVEFQELGQPLRLAKRPFERKDGSLVIGRMPDFLKESARDAIINDEAIKPTSRLARKNCFFSPVQCSFYYKRSSLF
ncbi:hypothetical protein AAVH_28032 [Aphelenchoides avenae]|nr:hypothetical protein AAVH_28032 [Aphelenchus avenae]